jgi:membrane associated rhomboid family serine protease
MIKNLKHRFKIADPVLKLIYINAGIFLVVQLLNTFSFLTQNTEINAIKILGLPSQFDQLIFTPWSLFTYMYTHEDFMHILLNLLWLHFSGRIFMQYFNSQKLIDLYVLGGFIGGISYLLGYKFLAMFQNQPNFLIGASASVLAILFASSAIAPNYKVNLPFIGPVPLMYIALASILIDVISIPKGNAGGHIAHLGGAITGIVFVLQWKKENDITKYINKTRLSLVRLLSKNKLKTVHKRPMNDDDFRTNKIEKSKKTDAILEKISRSGYDSLSNSEKDFLFNQSKKL